MDYYEQWLAHHGIKGQKWGVRRFQNADGTLTRKGMQRYNTAEDRYKKTSSAYQKAKEDYKSGKITERELGLAKGDNKGARREMRSAYKNVKFQASRDRGKSQVQKGGTIAGNRIKAVGMIMTSTAVNIGARQVNRMLLERGKVSLSTYMKAKVAINVGTMAVNAAITGNTIKKNTEIRRYRYGKQNQY